ncbi:MAG: hypothetical protein LUF27_12315 [Lachnospiraceae bacterium]|nr:hypothetical protein [Lachnospiraceae bacterium]
MNNLYGRESKQAKRNRKAREKEADSRSYHSLSYHRFFENYTEYCTTNERGKKKIIRKYTGPVYVQEIPKMMRMIMKLFFLLAFVLMAWLVYHTGAIEAQETAATAWYLAIAELLTILSLTYMGYTLLTGYLFAPQRMTTGDYKSSSKALIQAAKAAAACFGADAVFTAIGCLLSQRQLLRTDALHMAYFLAGAVLSLLIFQMERSIPYRVEEAAERPSDEEGTEILYR